MWLSEILAIRKTGIQKIWHPKIIFVKCGIPKIWQSENWEFRNSGNPKFLENMAIRDYGGQKNWHLENLAL